MRYIHLNPLRARLVKDLKALGEFPFSGHSVIMGKRILNWQDADYVLEFYGNKKTAARQGYRKYIQKGIADGQRPDLVGGGLNRSAGGWGAVKAMRRGMQRVKDDERILGDGDFVESVLQAAHENLDRKYGLKTKGCGFDGLVDGVATLMKLDPEDILSEGKYPERENFRSLLCYWGARELDMTTVELAKKVNLAQPTVSQSIARGQKIAQDLGLNISDLLNQ